MLETITVDVYGRSVEIVAGIPPSKHGAAVCRIRHGQNFHDDVLFTALFLDAACRFEAELGAQFCFLVPRSLAFPVSATLYALRNQFLHDPSQNALEIDGLQAKIQPKNGWFRVSLFCGPEPIIDGLEVFGTEALDDFCSGFLPLIEGFSALGEAEAAERAHHQKIYREIATKYGDDAFGGSTRENTAIHEAGHIFVGAVSGCAINRVVLEPPPDGGLMGWTGYVDFAPDPVTDLIAEARVSLAGIAAEEELTGEARIGEAISDIADAAACIHHFGGNFHDQLLEVYNETVEMVRAHRAVILRIADALKEHLSLDASDIARLMEA